MYWIYFIFLWVVSIICVIIFSCGVLHKCIICTAAEKQLYKFKVNNSAKPVFVGSIQSMFEIPLKRQLSEHLPCHRPPTVFQKGMHNILVFERIIIPYDRGGNIFFGHDLLKYTWILHLWGSTFIKQFFYY